tara:strand:+ start:101 stop:679 length:579 start_codon:yes stop_codon:yes gene_type:complete
MFDKADKFINNHHPNLFTNNTNTHEHLKNKLVGGSASCFSMKFNKNIFDYTVNNFIKSPSDKQVMTNSLQQGGSVVLPSSYFSPQSEHKNYSSKNLSNINYNDISSTNIRQEIPSTFGGDGEKIKKFMTIKDTNELLEQKKLTNLIGKKNLKMFNQQFNYNINTFLKKIETSNNKKITKKDIDLVFKNLIKK